MNARRPGSAGGRLGVQPGAPRPRPPADPVRGVAFDALRAVREQDAYANLVLPGLLDARELMPRDAAFATELVYGTLRALGTYDAILTACVDRPLDKLDPLVLDVLRLGAHQLLATRVGAHAAVDESVKLAREKVGHGPAGLVNAVLRKVASRDLASWTAELAPPFEDDPIGHLALVHSHPRWIVDAFRDALDGDLDETAALLAADNERPTVTLVARPGRSDIDELLALGAQPGRWAPTAAVLESGAPSRLAPVRDGRAGVQDEGSQLVALALANADLDGDDARWLDLCAGPGGKAALLGGLAVQRGARLLAAERQPHRAKLVRRAVGDTADVVVADGTAPVWAPGSFDRVLVDVPCSGLGALRRRPEARWRRQPTDLAGLRVLQAALLRSGIEAVRPGGLVAYVTCSPHRFETREVVDEVTATGIAVERIDVRGYLPGVPQLGAGPDVQLWPHRHGTDAMYLSLLRRLS
ncbi:MAG: rRNA (cytosine967-C5)-methyltransferase [Actinomycetota bacterium]|nr:rRNA (cytosine967-C5)-methyltransferase [Actinomycetota bacterium]